MDDLREDFDKAGFNGFIQKPINTSTLMNEIKKMLALNIVFGASTKI
jgi:FixJ family two-component response regulator